MSFVLGLVLLVVAAVIGAVAIRKPDSLLMSEAFHRKERELREAVSELLPLWKARHLMRQEEDRVDDLILRVGPLVWGLADDSVAAREERATKVRAELDRFARLTPDISVAEAIRSLAGRSGDDAPSPRVRRTLEVISGELQGRPSLRSALTQLQEKFFLEEMSRSRLQCFLRELYAMQPVILPPAYSGLENVVFDHIEARFGVDSSTEFRLAVHGVYDPHAQPRNRDLDQQVVREAIILAANLV